MEFANKLMEAKEKYGKHYAEYVCDECGEELEGERCYNINCPECSYNAEKIERMKQSANV